MQTRLLALIFTLSLVCFPAFRTEAEYRVFKLRIGPPDSQAFRLVDSHLDPLQYPTYYHVPKGHIVQYVDTWMCYGRTNDKAYCPSPQSSETTGATTRTPAAPPSQR